MTSAIFNRWLPCITLAAWSAILLYFSWTGQVKNFLAPPFRPYVLIAGTLLGLMALVFLLFRADASCCSASECGQSLSSFPFGRLLTFAIVIVPIAAAALFSPDSFGATVIKNRGITMDIDALGLRDRKVLPPPTFDLPTADGPAPIDHAASQQPPPPGTEAAPTAQTSPAADFNTSDYLSRTPEGYIEADVLDLLYAAQDNVLRGDFEGKTVQLVGQLMPDATSGGANRFKAVRMFMYCCAADSRPIATLVETEPLPDFPEMTWIKIVGVPTFPLENGRRISVLKAERVEKTEPPEEAMLF
jgi:uncharacterized repeat protein (TIGR03943 family)